MPSLGSRLVYVHAPREDWIVDRFVQEWCDDHRENSTIDPSRADVIWLLADWAWKNTVFSYRDNVSFRLDDLIRFRLQTEKNHPRILTTVHHVVPEKFGPQELADFQQRDSITTAYHVPNQHTHDFVRSLTGKPIHVIPYWANQRIWRPTETKGDLRKKHGLPEDGYLVGSFQRDTEGAGIPHGVFEPKLEKGPDKLADYLQGLRDYRCNRGSDHRPLHIVLAGWRRQYVMQRLDRATIPYTYFEKPSQEVINELYQTLDLYAVTARYEGGPQALIECGLLGVPVVSRDVGMASQVLPPSAINERVTLAQPAIPNVEHLKLPHGYEPFRKLIEEL